MPTPRCVAGCYGEPIFNRLFGVALSYFIITLPAFPEPYTDGIFIDAPLLVCFIFQTVALLVTLAAGMLDKFRIRSWLGWVRGPTSHSPFRLCAGREVQANSVHSTVGAANLPRRFLRSSRLLTWRVSQAGSAQDDFVLRCRF